ncbi:glycoside hydrolase superfamily [Aspergillus fruticulosus]
MECLGQFTPVSKAFEWHTPDGKAHWCRLRRMLPTVKAVGVDDIWISQGGNAMSATDNGYDVYDFYDREEFDQMGTRATKWGTKEELQSLVSRVLDFDIGIYWDAVLNHKAGAYSVERFSAVKVHPQSVDWDESRQEGAVFTISGPNKSWAVDVSNENGNYDYLMFANLDYSNPEVRDNVLHWSNWITSQLDLSQLDLSRMRLDALLADQSLTFRPQNLVANHDAQPGQSLETPTGPFFKPLAHALILLRTKGQPCLFYRDLTGLPLTTSTILGTSCASKFSTLMQACVLDGVQRDYFNKENCIDWRPGFVRYRNARYPFGLACIMSNAGLSRKRMFADILEGRTGTVKINRKGYGIFPVAAYSVSFCVNSSTECRENPHRFLDEDIYKY